MEVLSKGFCLGSLYLGGLFRGFTGSSVQGVLFVMVTVEAYYGEKKTASQPAPKCDHSQRETESLTEAQTTQPKYIMPLAPIYSTLCPQQPPPALKHSTINNCCHKLQFPTRVCVWYLLPIHCCACVCSAREQSLYSENLKSCCNVSTLSIIRPN